MVVIARTTRAIEDVNLIMQDFSKEGTLVLWFCAEVVWKRDKRMC